MPLVTEEGSLEQNAPVSEGTHPSLIVAVAKEGSLDKEARARLAAIIADD